MVEMLPPNDSRTGTLGRRRTAWNRCEVEETSNQLPPNTGVVGAWFGTHAVVPVTVRWLL